MLPAKTLSLADEFTARYFQLMFDGKVHHTAIDICSDEFKNQIEQDTTQEPCFFFRDKSGCDFVDGAWEIFGEIQ